MTETEIVAMLEKRQHATYLRTETMSGIVKVYLARGEYGFFLKSQKKERMYTTLPGILKAMRKIAPDSDWTQREW